MNLSAFKICLLFYIVGFTANSGCNKINVTVVSQAIADVINALGESHSMRFDVIVASRNEVLDTLANRILSKIVNPVNLEYCIGGENCTLYFGSPTVILMYDSEAMKKFDKSIDISLDKYGPIGITRRFTNTFTDTALIVYAIRSREFVLEDEKDSPLSSFYQIFHSSKNANDLILMNYVINTPQSCKSSWQTTNFFSSKTMMWCSLSFLQTYKSFYNCQLRVFANEATNVMYFKYLLTNEKKENGQRKFGGILGEMMKDFSKKYEAQLVDAVNTKNFDILLVPLHEIISAKYPKYFSVLHVSPPICYVYSTFMTTRGYRYTFFEKLFLPFDNSIWFALILTFLAAFTTIFVISRFSLDIQNYVFGRNVYFPSLGSIQIFFGLGFVHVPHTNFGRYLFMTFTIFCLIIRTAYQSKMFDFMITDVRHSMPNTVEELLHSDVKILGDNEGNIDAVDM